MRKVAYSSDSFIFVFTPKTVEKGCLKCFVNFLKDNESFYYPILKACIEKRMNEPVGRKRECNLSQAERKIVDSLVLEDDKVAAVVSKDTYKVEYLPIHCHCLSLCDEVLDTTGGNVIDFSKEIDFEKRVISGKTLFNKDRNRRLLNPHSGIGKKIVNDPDSLYVPMYYVRSYVLSARYYSYGRAVSFAKSRMSAEFEMLERYASIVPHKKPEQEGSYKELAEKGISVIHPPMLTLNRVDESITKQYGFVPYSDADSYRWNEATDVVENKKVYLPEQVLYYDGQLVSHEKRFIYETSNGTAMGGNYEEAIAYALLESVERDAFLMHWYNNLAPKKLDISGIEDKSLVKIIRYMEAAGYKVLVMDITMETKIPAIWVAAIDEKHGGKVKCYNAAGAHVNPEKALEAALIEVSTSIGIYDRMLASGEKDDDLQRLSNRPDKVNQMEDHVFFYSLEENFKYIEHYFTNEIVVDFRERFKDWYEERKATFTLKEFIDKFSKYHKHIYVAMLYSPVNAELGIYCVKTVIPSMLTMTFGVKNQRINVERIVEGAVISGISDKKIREEDINMTPHPFP